MEKADTIIFSSIFHEIYSYTDLGRSRFDQRSIDLALTHAIRSLAPGARLDLQERSVVTDINFSREFLYTYTWGVQSFPHELQLFGFVLQQNPVKNFARGMALVHLLP